MGAAERRKGHDYERWLVRDLREVYGDQVCRGWQCTQYHQRPDVQAGANWIEAKNRKRVNVRAALEQAESTCPGGYVPVAITKQPRKRSMVSMYYDDWKDMLLRLRRIDHESPA